MRRRRTPCRRDRRHRAAGRRSDADHHRKRRRHSLPARHRSASRRKRKEIQPHPKGIELGILIQMMKDYEDANKGGGTLYNFLQEKFCRVSPGKASEFCKAIGVHSRTKVGDLEPQQIEKLFKEFQEAKLPPPPTDCLAPIGVRQLLAGHAQGREGRVLRRQQPRAGCLSRPAVPDRSGDRLRRRTCRPTTPPA